MHIQAWREQASSHLKHPQPLGGSPFPISLGVGFPCYRDSNPFPKRNQLGALIDPPVLHVEEKTGPSPVLLLSSKPRAPAWKDKNIL